jgi:hypothetical protein
MNNTLEVTTNATIAPGSDANIRRIVVPVDLSAQF